MRNLEPATVANVGQLVRVRRRAGKSPHLMRGRLVGMEGDTALVALFGHRRVERIEARLVTPWKSRAVAAGGREGGGVIEGDARGDRGARAGR